MALGVIQQLYEVFMLKTKLFWVALCCLAVSGCISAQEHRKNVSDDTKDRITVGTVQREIRVGMSGADVAASLGSPNIVTTNEDNSETWIYDKISTEIAYSASSGSAGGALLGGAPTGIGLLGAIGGGSYSSGAGASSTSQKTLTVIIKFNKSGRVHNIAYHTSSF